MSSSRNAVSLCFDTNSGVLTRYIGKSVAKKSDRKKNGRIVAYSAVNLDATGYF